MEKHFVGLLQGTLGLVVVRTQPGKPEQLHVAARRARAEARDRDTATRMLSIEAAQMYRDDQ